MAPITEDGATPSPIMRFDGTGTLEKETKPGVLYFGALAAATTKQSLLKIMDLKENDVRQILIRIERQQMRSGSAGCVELSTNRKFSKEAWVQMRTRRLAREKQKLLENKGVLVRYLANFKWEDIAKQKVLQEEMRRMRIAQDVQLQNTLVQQYMEKQCRNKVGKKRRPIVK